MKWLLVLAVACGSNGKSIDASHGDSPPIDNPDALSCTATSACWTNCFQYDTPIAMCKTMCGLGDGVSCWQLCTNQSYALSSCKGYCNADPGCEAALCWENCGSTAVPASTCVTTCGMDTTACAACTPMRSAHDQCVALCAQQGVSSSICG